jgi:hypothetical protein
MPLFDRSSGPVSDPTFVKHLEDFRAQYKRYKIAFDVAIDMKDNPFAEGFAQKLATVMVHLNEIIRSFEERLARSS